MKYSKNITFNNGCGKLCGKNILKILKKVLDKLENICYNTDRKKDIPIVTPPTVSSTTNTIVRLTAWKDSITYKMKGKNVMSTVEIFVLFEESSKRREEEAKRAEEMRMVSKIKELEELEMLMDEVKAEAEKIKDELKAEMKKRNTEELKVGQYIVRWTEVLSNRFDTTNFKRLFPNMYKDFTKEVSSRRFSISR